MTKYTITAHTGNPKGKMTIAELGVFLTRCTEAEVNPDTVVAITTKGIVRLGINTIAVAINDKTR